MTGPMGGAAAADPRLRMRMWVDAELVDETWIDSSGSDALGFTEVVGHRHVALKEQAEREGRVWLVEIYDPAQPEDQAYKRFGTDAAGMFAPRPIR